MQKTVLQKLQEDISKFSSGSKRLKLKIFRNSVLLIRRCFISRQFNYRYITFTGGNNNMLFISLYYFGNIVTLSFVIWGRFNIQISPYQYMDPHVKDKTVSRLSYLQHGNPHTWERRLYIKTVPRFPHLALHRGKLWIIILPPHDYNIASLLPEPILTSHATHNPPENVRVCF